MNKGTENYTRPIVGALMIVTLLYAQGSGYLSQKLMVENNIRAVSYTHLTLPTILLV